MDRLAALGAALLLVAAGVGGWTVVAVPAADTGPDRENTAYVAEHVDNESAVADAFEGAFSVSLHIVDPGWGYEAPTRTRQVLRAATDGTVQTTNQTVLRDLVQVGLRGAFVEIDQSFYRYRLVVANETATVSLDHATRADRREYVASRVVTPYEELNASQRETFDRLPVVQNRSGFDGYYPWPDETLTDGPTAVERDGTLYVVGATGHTDTIGFGGNLLRFALLGVAGLAGLLGAGALVAAFLRRR